ncbi:hypothetical protein ACE6H2_020656 [Prunus campanulata]
MSNSGDTTDGAVSVPMALLPGIRFSPTEEELLSFYLEKKIAGEDSEFSNFIGEINACEHEPRDLPEYFFSKPNYMNTNSNRCFRTTGEGYYKSTGQVREVKAELSQAVIGNKRILPFLEGRAPKGKITKYVMHEFSLPKTKQAQLDPNQQREFVLNHLTTKSVNYKKRRYDSICDKLAEPGIASNYKDERVSFQPERNRISPFHPSSLADDPLRSPVHTELLGDVVYANNSILLACNDGSQIFR